MKRVFVINHSVRFDPLSRMLVVLDRPEVMVQLHTPASECLRLLVSHNGETLTHQFLSEEVWEKKGSYVTANSLYQNIAAIRRGLKAVGLDETMLKTIPKTGFQIYASIEEEDLPPVIKESSAPLSAPENKAEPLTPRRVMQPTLSLSKMPIKIFYLAIFFIFISGSFLLYQQITLNRYHFDSYTHIGSINKCDVYSSYSGKEKSTDIFNALIKSSSLTCPMGGKAWLTFNANYRMSSIVMCDQNIYKDGVNCKSYIYSGDVNEKL